MKAVLSDPDWAELVGEELKDAVYFADLTWADVGALLPHRSTHEITIEQVEDIADPRVESARQLSDRIVANVSARLLISVDVRLPSAAAGSIDEDDALVFSGSDERGDARASALRTVRGHFETTFDQAGTELLHAKLRRLARTRG